MLGDVKQENPAGGYEPSTTTAPPSTTSTDVYSAYSNTGSLFQSPYLQESGQFRVKTLEKEMARAKKIERPSPRIPDNRICILSA